MSFDVLQSIERWLPVVLTAQSNGIDPVTDADYDDLIVKYRKEGDESATTKNMTVDDWVALDSGVYKIKFLAAELNTLKTFLYSVELKPVNFCDDFVPYYGAVEVVAATVNEIDTQLDAIEGKVDTVDGVVDNIYIDTQQIVTDVGVVDGKVDTLQTDITAIDGKVDNVYTDTQQIISDIAAIDTNFYEVAAGAYYDGSGTLTVSLVLHNSGSPVTSPTGAAVALYTEDGTLVTSDTSSSPDAQGAFKFTLSATLTNGTVPYVSGVVTDGSGSHASIVLTPVVG